MFRLFTVFFFLLLSLSGYGQDTTTLSTTAREVVVTGARFARPAAASPQRVTVIDSARVAQAADLGQLLSEQAGIVINGAYSNPGKDRSIFLRNGANQFTLILVDGQPLLDPSSLGGAVDLRLLSLEGIERVEILRGARSLLYGSDAVAGVINLITRKGSATDPFTLHLRAAAQSYATLEAGVAVSGTTEKVDYRLGYDIFSTEGISEAEAPAGSSEVFGKDGARRETLNATLRYRPNAFWTIRPALRLAGFSGDYDAGSFRDADNTYTNDLVLPSLAVSYARGKTSVGMRANYAKTDRIFNSAFGESAFRGRMHQEDLFATYRPTDRATVTLGTQARHERLDQTEKTLTATTLSPYLQLNLDIATDLLLEAGYRFNHHSDFGGQRNWSLALGVRSTEQWSSRVSLGSAFQSPTLDQLGGPFGANPDLAPQVATSVELNTQLAAPDGSYRLSLTAFQRNVRDLIVFDFATGYRNQDELRDRGLEVEAAGRLHPRIDLSGNVTYVRGRLRQPDSQGGTTETDEFFRRPRTSAAAHLTFTAKKPLLARLSALYTGERPDIWFDEDFASTTTTLQAYWLVNAYAEYRLLPREQLKLFVDLRNLTDTDFVEVTGFSTQGVTVRGGVAVRW